MAEQIERCVCGRNAALFESGFGEGWRGQCLTCKCWAGPWRKTKQGAIAAWNRVMKAARRKV